jgi:hypothetical protein
LGDVVSSLPEGDAGPGDTVRTLQSKGFVVLRRRHPAQFLYMTAMVKLVVQSIDMRTQKQFLEMLSKVGLE